VHPLIDDNRQAIANLCSRHGVLRLEAFGSILRSDFDLDSDVDIVVEFEPTAAGSFENFLSLKESLETLLERSVDLVELHAIRNRRLRHYIEKGRSPIYDAA
jgi:predicted nucleotidyltransferase